MVESRIYQGFPRAGRDIRADIISSFPLNERKTKSGRTQESERRAPPLDLKIVEVGESAADPVEHGEPGLGVGRQRGRCPWRELVRAQRAANAVGSRTGALPGREKAEILAEAERRGGQAGHGRLLVTVVAEETRHRVGGRLAEAGRR